MRPWNPPPPAEFIHLPSIETESDYPRAQTIAEIIADQRYWTKSTEDLKEFPPKGIKCYCKRQSDAVGARTVCKVCRDYPDYAEYNHMMDKARIVYFITIPSGFVKIGSTTNIVERMASIQSSQAQPISLRAVIHGSFGLEFKMHLTFNRLRAQGEWFKNPELIVKCAIDEFGATVVVE